MMPADRVGADLADCRRGQRDRDDLAELFERLPAAAASAWGPRFCSIMVQRGRNVCLIQLSQAVINSADLLVVGFLSTWSDVGRYGAPHRMVTALLTFGLILAAGRVSHAVAVVAADRRRRPRGPRLAGRSPDDGAGAGGRRLHRPGRPAGPPCPSRQVMPGPDSCWPWASGEHPC